MPENNIEHHDPTQSYEELQALIRELPQDMARLVAGRCAYRVMPLLATTRDSYERPFVFWGDQAAWYLRSLDAACLIALSVASYDSQDVIDVAWQSNMKAQDGSANAVHRAVGCIQIAAGANRTDYSSVVINSVYAEDYASVTITDSDDENRTLSAIVRDLDLLNNTSYIEKIRNTPLWHSREHELGEKWHGIIDRWRDALKSFGLDDIASRYDRLCKGGGLDEDEVEHVIKKWKAEYREKEAKESETKSYKKKKDSKQGDDEVNTVRTSTSSASITPQPPGLATGMADRPAGVDSLGRMPLVDTLARVFTHAEQSTPMTLALLGEWGSGKSSVLTQLRKQIKDQSGINGRIPCVFAEFNAWEHENCEDMQAGLAQTVISGLTEGLSWRDRFKIVVRFAKSEHLAELWKLLGALGLLVPVHGINAGDCCRLV